MLMAAWAFAAQLEVKEELGPQSIGKNWTPLGKVPPVTDAQL